MKERVRQCWAAFAHGDLEGGLALLSDNIVFTISGTTLFSGVIVGKDALRAHLQRFGASLEPGAQMHVRERIAEGDVVVCLSEGTMRAKTGRDYNNTYAGVEGVSHVLDLSEGSSKLIPIHEEPNHQIVHLFCLGKAQRPTH